VGRYDHAIERANNRDLGLTPELAVLPSAMKKAGYACAVFGKWHLGYEPKFNPMEYGWDEFFGYLGGNVHYFNHRETSDLHVLFRGRLPVHREGYMTHLITDDSIGFLRRSAKAKHPFFLYISHECPHFPFQGPGDAEKPVTTVNWMERDAKTYVAMLEDLDKEVGRIVRAIDEAGISKDTLLVFASDNGGFAGAAHMGPLSGAKGTTLEGGIRVPLIIRCPGRIPAGLESNQVCITFDLTRSFLNLAKAEVDPSRLDGYDIISHVADHKPDIKRTLYWRGRRGDRTWRAVRDADTKFVSKSEGGTLEEWMYNLTSDVGERRNIMTTELETARRLKRLLVNWEQRMMSSH
jgi:N-acetylgalactosamine-6-sulfatase